MPLTVLTPEEVLSPAERRERLDRYRSLMRELDRHMVNSLSYEDSNNPVWDAKVLFQSSMERFSHMIKDLG